MQPITLYHVDVVRNMQRFYHLDIQPDLFGNICLMKRWGRIGRQGTLHSIPYPTVSAAYDAFEKQRQKKEKKGYVSQ